MNRRATSLPQRESMDWLRPMVRAMFCVIVVVGMSTYLAQAQTVFHGSILGYLYDETSREGIPFASIGVFRNAYDSSAEDIDLKVTGGSADAFGILHLTGVKSDTAYALVVSAPGYRTVLIRDCPVIIGPPIVVELGLQLGTDTLTPLVIYDGYTFERSEQFKEAFNEREKSNPYSSEVFKRNGGYVGNLRRGPPYTYIDGVRIYSNGTTEPPEPLPPILNRTPAEMENRQEAPEAP